MSDIAPDSAEYWRLAGPAGEVSCFLVQQDQIFAVCVLRCTTEELLVAEAYESLSTAEARIDVLRAAFELSGFVTLTRNVG